MAFNLLPWFLWQMAGVIPLFLGCMDNQASQISAAAMEK